MANKEEKTEKWKRLSELIDIEEGDTTREVLAKAKARTTELEQDIGLIEKDMKKTEGLEDEIRDAAGRHGSPYLKFFGELDKERSMTAKEHRLLLFYRAMFFWYRDWLKKLPALLEKQNNGIYDYLGYRVVTKESPKKREETQVGKKEMPKPTDEQIELINELEAEGLSAEAAMKKFCEKFTGIGAQAFYRWRLDVLNDTEDAPTEAGG